MAQMERILVGIVGDVRIGVPVGDLVEVLRAPEAGPGDGEIRYRGGSLPVLDLVGRFGATGAEPAPRSRVLVLRVPAPLGIRVSGVEGIVEMSGEAIAPAARFQAPGERLLRGLVRIGNRTILLVETAGLAAMAGGAEDPRGRLIPERRP